MLWMKDLPYEPPYEPPCEAPPEAAPAGERRGRAVAAALLRLASRALDRLAERLALVPEVEDGDYVVEYHAEAGAPEGALYVNGRLVGHVLGVRRL